MPGLNKHLFVLQHETCDTVHFMLPKSFVLCEGNRLQPEFCDLPIPLDMDVDRLVLVRTEENETVWTLPQNSRHDRAKAQTVPLSSSSISTKAVAVDKKEVAKCADSPIF